MRISLIYQYFFKYITTTRDHHHQKTQPNGTFQSLFFFRKHAAVAGLFQHLDVWNQQQLSIKKDIHFIRCPNSNWSIVRRCSTTTVATGEATKQWTIY